MFRRFRQPATERAVWLILLFTGAGLALRLALLIHAGWRYDYDEGMVGLQVLRILRGEYPTFHPGQPYLAALESYLIAPVFALFGANAITLKLIPWLLSGGYIGTIGCLGWRAFDRQVAVISALLAACPPTYLLVTGMKTWGATVETLLLGNLALITASHVFDHTHPDRIRTRALIVLGFVGGVAFWVSWLIAFYAFPIVIVLLWQERPLLRRWAWLALTAFFMGSFPFWYYNLHHDFATFHYLLGDQGNTQQNVWRVLDHMNYDLAPRLVSGDPAWHLLSWPAIWWLQIVYESGLVALIIGAWLSKQHDPHQATKRVLALFAASVPTIYVASGWGNHALNQFGFDATGRYLLMLHSVLPIGAASIIMSVARWRRGLRWVAALLLTSVISFNLLGTVRSNPSQVFVSPYYTRQPTTLDPLIDYLRTQDIRHVWTDVGLAHVLMFETQEEILAADWYDIYGAKGILRFPEVPEAILAANRVAYVEVILPDQTDTPFEQVFQAAGVPITVAHPSPDIIVIIPHVPVDPAILGDGLGYQF